MKGDAKSGQEGVLADFLGLLRDFRKKGKTDI